MCWHSLPSNLTCDPYPKYISISTKFLNACPPTHHTCSYVLRVASHASFVQLIIQADYEFQTLGPLSSSPWW